MSCQTYSTIKRKVDIDWRRIKIPFFTSVFYRMLAVPLTMLMTVMFDRWTFWLTGWLVRIVSVVFWQEKDWKLLTQFFQSIRYIRIDRPLTKAICEIKKEITEISNKIKTLHQISREWIFGSASIVSTSPFTLTCKVKFCIFVKVAPNKHYLYMLLSVWSLLLADVIFFYLMAQEVTVSQRAPASCKMMQPYICLS